MLPHRLANTQPPGFAAADSRLCDGNSLFMWSGDQAEGLLAHLMTGATRVVLSTDVSSDYAAFLGRPVVCYL